MTCRWHKRALPYCLEIVILQILMMCQRLRLIEFILLYIFLYLYFLFRFFNNFFCLVFLKTMHNLFVSDSIYEEGKKLTYTQVLDFFSQNKGGGRLLREYSIFSPLSEQSPVRRDWSEFTPVYGNIKTKFYHSYHGQNRRVFPFPKSSLALFLFMKNIVNIKIGRAKMSLPNTNLKLIPKFRIIGNKRGKSI